MIGPRVLQLIAIFSGLSAGAGLADPVAQNSVAPETQYRSPIHICLSRTGNLAYVVNETAHTVSILNLSERRVAGEIEVGARPTYSVLSPDGKRLYVTCQWDSAVDVIDVDNARVERSIALELEPYGIAVSPNGETLFVADSLSEAVYALEADTGRFIWKASLGRGPRFVSLTADGSRVLVTGSLARAIWIVDASTGRVLEKRDLDRANLLRQIVVTSDDRLAFVAHVLSHDELIPFQMERGFIHANGFSILDLQNRGHRVTLLLDRLLAGAANPWGLALSSDNQRLYVSLAGVHEIAIVDVPAAVELARKADTAEKVRALEKDVEILERLGIMRRVPTGGLGPRGIALNEATGELLVTNYFSDTISVLDASTGDVRAIIPLGKPQEMILERKGEMLFNDARLCFQQWFSCASCHEENATVDGLNWDLSNDGVGNPKNVKSLHDGYDTPPAMWSGIRKDMDVAVAAGQRFLGFPADPENHRALVAFLREPGRPPNPHRGKEPEAVMRGETIFYRTRCHACHPQPTYTDKRKHDLGLAHERDFNSRFDTPSLRDCYRTAPYFHDGRAETLRTVFTEHNPHDLHGRTSTLTQEELDDLLAYLRTR